MCYLDKITERYDEGAQKMSYDGIRTAQRYGVWHALDMLYSQLVSEGQDVSRIIEIGTNFGGFTRLLRDHPLSENAEIITFDIVDKGLHAAFKDTDIVSYKQDVFKNETQVGNLICRPGLTILFCDGGNKPREFQTFAKYLKYGDIILGHDYAVDFQDYADRVNRFWCWCELQEKDIAATCKQYDLVPYLQETFKNYVWAIRIKK